MEKMIADNCLSAIMTTEMFFESSLGRFMYDEQYDGYKRVCLYCNEYVVKQGLPYCNKFRNRLCDKHYTSLLPEIIRLQDAIDRCEREKKLEKEKLGMKNEARNATNELRRLNMPNKPAKAKLTDEKIQVLKDAGADKRRMRMEAETLVESYALPIYENRADRNHRDDDDILNPYIIIYMAEPAIFYDAWLFYNNFCIKLEVANRPVALRNAAKTAIKKMILAYGPATPNDCNLIDYTK
jgi:hypothetical protein